MSQYDINKLTKEPMVTLTWHGEPTKVKIYGDDEKTEVTKDQDLKVSLNQAKELLRYSDFWTLKGDKPTDQPWRKANEEAMKALDKKNKADNEIALNKSKKGNKETAEPVKAEPKEEAVAVTKEAAEAMQTKEEIIKALNGLKIKVNSNATLDELKAVLLESVEPKEEAVK